MKTSFLLLLFIGACLSINAQRLPTWYRVYTFDDSRIDMNTSNLVLGGDIGRVTFRWTFDQPEVLRSEPRLKFKIREETIEFRCGDNLYRTFEMVLLDASGQVLRSELMSAPYEWRRIEGSVMSTISIPACELINRALKPLTSKPESDEQTELDTAARLALSFIRDLEQSRDFKPMMRRFFAREYLNGYRQEPEANWFWNVDKVTAGKASRVELERYYVATLNAAYLSSLYLISQSSEEDDSPDEPVPEDRLVPADALQLIKTHPYSAAFKQNANTYDYLAENIDSLPRLRSYTDLMERIATLMRRHVARVNAEKSNGYRAFLKASDGDQRTRICATPCLGLPQGTKLFEFSGPIFRLQLAKIGDQLKIVSISEKSAK